MRLRLVRQGWLMSLTTRRPFGDIRVATKSAATSHESRRSLSALRVLGSVFDLALPRAKSANDLGFLPMDRADRDTYLP